jgi:hypothetical protein
VLIDGFPSKGNPAPRFVVAYNFSSLELDDSDAIDALKDALYGDEPSAEPGSQYVGIFESAGSYYYSNGSAFCRYPSYPVMQCMAGMSDGSIPDRTGLLGDLVDGGPCAPQPGC